MGVIETAIVYHLDLVLKKVFHPPFRMHLTHPLSPSLEKRRGTMNPSLLERGIHCEYVALI